FARDRLIFEDGTPARFWGTNLTAYALFGMNSYEDVRLQARRLSQLSFNLVRFHHHDSSWVNPNIFGNGNRHDTKSLSEAMLQKLDWWIKCLKDEGIYVWLDLEVQRRLKLVDGIINFDEMSRGKSKSINLAHVDIAVSTPNATVAVQSMDEKSIGEAGAIENHAVATAFSSFDSQ